MLSCWVSEFVRIFLSEPFSGLITQLQLLSNSKAKEGKTFICYNVYIDMNECLVKHWQRNQSKVTVPGRWWKISKPLHGMICSHTNDPSHILQRELANWSWVLFWNHLLLTWSRLVKVFMFVFAIWWQVIQTWSVHFILVSVLRCGRGGRSRRCCRRRWPCC